MLFLSIPLWVLWSNVKDFELLTLGRAEWNWRKKGLFRKILWYGRILVFSLEGPNFEPLRLDLNGTKVNQRSIQVDKNTLGNHHTCSPKELGSGARWTLGPIRVEQTVKNFIPISSCEICTRMMLSKMHIDEKILKLTPNMLSIIFCPSCPIEFIHFPIIFTNEAG